MVSIQHGRLQLPVLRRAGARRAPREVVCLPSGLHGLQTNTTVIVQDYEPVYFQLRQAESSLSVAE